MRKIGTEGETETESEAESEEEECGGVRVRGLLAVSLWPTNQTKHNDTDTIPTH
jgi:hypothetical protein